jgi:hypothetical protein
MPSRFWRADGLAVPAGVAVKVVENTDNLIHVVLPMPPSTELSEADLEKVAGGAAGGGRLSKITIEAIRAAIHRNCADEA